MGRSSMIRADSPLETTETEVSSDMSSDRNRRMSNITATSISSFPDSPLPSDTDGPLPFYTAKPRPTFRVGSLRRSPLPDRLSPSLRAHKSLPRRPRSRGEDVVFSAEAPAPLVLLHATILPPRLPWSRSVLESTLPLELKQRLGVLRAQSSGLVAQRGVLIAHPHEEFEMLEESVLEALGLLAERIGGDGQFRPRTPSLVGDERDEEDKESCETCQKVHGRDEGAGWYVRVYAANGLMRAGAWAAAWNEMERVDVEVLPCVDDDVRRMLDEAQVMAHAGQESYQRPAIEPSPPPVANDIQMIQPTHHDEPEKTMSPQQETEEGTKPSPTDELPQVYRPKEIPLRILLRNYIYLLLQDRRNLAIIFLGLMLLISTTHGISTTKSLQNDMNDIGGVTSSPPLASLPVDDISPIPIQATPSAAVESQNTGAEVSSNAYKDEENTLLSPGLVLSMQEDGRDDMFMSSSSQSFNPAMVLSRPAFTPA